MKFKVKEIKEPYKMISYWKNQWLLVVGMTFAGIIYNCGLAIGPMIQGEIIDRIINKSGSLMQWIGLFIGIIAVVQICRYFKRYEVRIFANRTSATMRNMVYKSIVERDVQELKDEKTGDLMTKAISDVDGCVEGMRKFTTEVFDTGVVMIAYFLAMSNYDLKTTALAIIFVPIAMFIAERLKTMVYKYSGQYREQLSKVAETTNENISKELLYRINSVEDVALERYSSQLEDLQKKAVRANVLETAMQPIYRVVALLGILLIVYICGNKVVEGAWTVGDFSAYITIFIEFAGKASKSGKLFNSVQKALVSWKRIKPYLECVQGKTEEDVEDTGDRVTLRVENLSFGKVKKASFEISTGQILGVTGPIASGKSLIGMALQGLWPYEGTITIEESRGTEPGSRDNSGKDIAVRELRDMTSAEISHKIAYMGHDSQLLSDTIYNNITLGSGHGATLRERFHEIEQVLGDVDFLQDLENMDEGVDTIVGESGVRLSGGQQARLALARALYNKSRIMVLDEPFASVDINTENRIIENIRSHYGDSAIVLISHRVSSFENVDKVLYVEDGKTSLISQGGELHE